MAICLQCGTIMHDDDMKTHICDVANLAVKGKEKIPTTTEKVKA